MEDPNEIQHGGDHYRKAGDLQHWDMVADLGGGWEYYVARATAYLTRIKDEELDPKKAVHFIDKMLKLLDEGRLPAIYESAQHMRRGIDSGYARNGDMVDVDEYLRRYFRANSISMDSDEAEAITLLVKALNSQDLKKARIVAARFAGLPQLPDSNKAQDPSPFQGTASAFSNPDSGSTRNSPHG